MKISSANPARAWGLEGRKGAIAEGADADLVLVDLERRETLAADMLHSRGKVSAFEGKDVTGWPVATLVRGKVVMREGELLAEPGWGEPVVQQMPTPEPRNLEKHIASLVGASPAPVQDAAE